MSDHIILGCFIVAAFGVGWIMGGMYGYNLRGREIDRAIDDHNNQWR